MLNEYVLYGGMPRKIIAENYGDDYFNQTIAIHHLGSPNYLTLAQETKKNRLDGTNEVEILPQHVDTNYYKWVDPICTETEETLEIEIEILQRQVRKAQLKLSLLNSYNH